MTRFTRRARGYALMIVLLVLALMSVGLSTLYYFLEASAETTGSMLERRRVFYACDGIGRAATVLAQSYMVTSAPTTPGLIDSVCTDAGGGCCVSPTGTPGDCDTATPPTSEKTALMLNPAGAGPTALPKIVPAGFKIMNFSIASTAADCLVDATCGVGGTCVAGHCRTVSPLPNGPFQGMNARQDTIAIDIRAEHRATSGFACRTQQTISLGKIAMFQFFLFSDSQYTDWHPGPAMRATGRMHANGDLVINPASPVLIERVTAAGDLRCMSGTTAVVGNCAADTAAIANRLNPDFNNSAHFTEFHRTNATWAQDALADWNGNAQDRIHGVPRLQLPVVGSPAVQRGFNAADNAIDNVNIVGGVKVTNSRLLVDPVRTGDPADVRSQKFAQKADIRIVNGVWYLRNPASANDFPGVPIWSDHAGHYTTRDVVDFKGGADVGQGDLDDPLPQSRLAWGGRVPQRFSYYGATLGTSQLTYDLDADTTAATLTPPFSSRAVVSYGSLFRDPSAGEGSAVWRPGPRTLRRGRAEQNAAGTRNASGAVESFCEANSGAGSLFHGMLDALSLDDNTANVDPCPAGGSHPSRAAALLAATRSGFRNGYSEFDVCGTDDRDDDASPNCDGVGETADRRAGNILPLNFDLAAFQEALGDTTAGELGSFFCAAGTPTCGSFMGAPFNGIVYIAAPYPGEPGATVNTNGKYLDPAMGSERGYGTNGGVDVPHPLRVPRQSNAAHMTPAVADLGTVPAPALGPTWTAGAPLPIVVDDGQELHDDEVAALPALLCSDDQAGQDMSTFGWRFVRPACPDTLAADANVTWVSGVRVINARRVNSNTAPTAAPTVADAAFLPAFPSQPVLSASAVGTLPQGISIVTNLPLYVVGDVNLTSDAFSTVAAKPWVPVLLAGDTVHPLSNFWDDARARWAESTGDVDRHASVTRYNMEMLAGWGMTVSGSASGGIHNFPRFLEDWGETNTGDCKGTGAFSGACPAIITGSLVIGHSRVYTAGVGPEQTPGDIGRSPPRRDWGFDRHLEDLSKQPPGAPIYDVAAIKQWNRN